MPGRIRLAAWVGLAVLGVAVASCAPLVVGAAVGAGGVASEQRGVGGFVSDIGIQTAINDRWFKHSPSLHSRLDITVDQGRVMLTGRAQDAQERLDAVRLASGVDGVREVINEIQVGPSTGLTDTAKDTWISTQVRSALTFDRNIGHQNYSITTVEGVVYLLGTARSQRELDAVLHHARSVKDVRRVVNHVQLPS